MQRFEINSVTPATYPFSFPSPNFHITFHVIFSSLSVAMSLAFQSPQNLMSLLPPSDHRDTARERSVAKPVLATKRSALRSQSPPGSFHPFGFRVAYCLGWARDFGVKRLENGEGTGKWKGKMERKGCREYAKH